MGILLRTIAVAVVFLVAGGAIGRYLLTLPPEKIIVRETVPQKASETVYLKWVIASSFAADLPQFGTLGRRLAARLTAASGGRIRATMAEPGKLVEPALCFGAVSEGKVQACWSTPGHWYNKERALSLFSGVPFGPDAREFLAWYYHGGGQGLLDEIYARHGLKSIVCGVTAPEGGGWFLKEIATPEDFKGLRIRFYGLGARVVERLGAKTLRLNAQELTEAIKAGRIDGFEYSIPVIDVGARFHETVKHYYLPGWHKPATLLELLVRRSTWEALPEATRALIETTCGDSILEGLARGEAMQPAAVREIKAKGVTIHRWSPEVLAALRTAWGAVIKEESAADPSFKKVWQSLFAFRNAYSEWRRLGRLP